MMHAEGLKLLIFLALGALLGLGYFGVLEWNVQLYFRNSSPLFALSIHALRFLGTATVFVTIARTGAASSLSALAGFQFVRIFAVRAKCPSPEVTS